MDLTLMDFFLSCHLVPPASTRKRASGTREQSAAGGPKRHEASGS